jgi:hypothetical protein
VDSADFRIRFERGCVGATVYASRPPIALEIVLDTGDSERIIDLEQAASYVLRLAPQAVVAGRTIVTLAVETASGTGRTTLSAKGKQRDSAVFHCES